MLDDHSDATKMSTYVSSGNRPITIHHRRSIRMQQSFLLPNTFTEALFLLQLDNVKRISCRHSASVELKPIPKWPLVPFSSVLSNGLLNCGPGFQFQTWTTSECQENLSFINVRVVENVILYSCVPPHKKCSFVNGETFIIHAPVLHWAMSF